MLEVVVFQNVDGSITPVRPWPQSFYISRSLLELDAVELRPLTFTGIVKGIGRNFVTMSFWRTCWILRRLGFLKTDQAHLYQWRDLTLACWRYWMPERLLPRRVQRWRQERSSL